MTASLADSSLLKDPRITPFDSMSDSEVEALFDPLSSATGLLLAVSGGPDSLALLMLAARWRALRLAAERAPPMYVASVDHGLRPSATMEAVEVVALAERIGFPARVLTWRGEKPQHGLQEAARDARYQLLAAMAREKGASHVVTAHHQDDQAETVLMRLSGGSGVGGLAAMRPLSAMRSTNASPLLLARPLLTLCKERLVAVVLEAGLNAVDDPANRDTRFARGRLRHLDPERAALGLTTTRLAKLADRCARADDALSAVARARFAALAKENASRVTLCADLWREPEEILLRVLALAVTNVGKAVAVPVSLERLERLGQDMRIARDSQAGLRRTLHGTTVRLSSSGEIEVAPESARSRGVKSRHRDESGGLCH